MKNLLKKIILLNLILASHFCYPQSLLHIEPEDTVLLRPSSTGTLYTSLNQYTMGDYDWNNAADPAMPIFHWGNYTEDSWDVLVEEQVRARLPIITMTSRGVNKPGDRTDLGGIGNHNAYRLTGFVDALNRAGLDSSVMRVLCFIDTEPQFLWQRELYPQLDHERFDWSHEAGWENIIWLRMIKPWFETIPQKWWFRINGRPVIQFWGVNPARHFKHAGNINKAFTYLANAFEAAFGERPWFVIDESARNLDLTLVQNDDFYSFSGWFDVARKVSWQVPNHHKGRTVGGGCPGFIPPNGDPNSTIPRRGGQSLLDALTQAKNRNATYALIEGWEDCIEGAGMYRSDHKDWSYPNFYINMFRQFTDPETETIRLEAESVDDYYDTSPGNAGGKYRLSGNLDVADMPGGIGWYVGWTSAGEWIEYKQIYFSDGDYKFPVKYASPTSQRLSLEVDGVSLGEVTVPSTGGWDKFETIYLGFAHLSQGNHTFRINFITGDVNIDWMFVKKGTLPGDAVLPANPIKIKVKHTGKSLGVTGSSNAEGASIEQQSNNDADYQKWNIAIAGGGYYKIINIESGKCLQVESASDSLNAGIQQGTWANSLHQKWSIQNVANGYLKIVNAKSGKFLAVKDASVADGAKIIQQLFDNSDNQLWQIEPGASASGKAGMSSNPSPLHGIQGASIVTSLTWTAGTGALSHNIYFGTNPVLTANDSVGNQTTTTYNPGELSYGITYYWRVDEVNSGGKTTGDVWSFTTKTANVQTPYYGMRMSIPGIIQAEDFDNGGNGISYLDSTAGNSGGAYRTNEDVDIDTTSSSAGGYCLGGIDDGEWLEYTVSNVDSGLYIINFLVASSSQGNKSIAIQLGEVDLGIVDIPKSGEGTKWKIVQLVTQIPVTKGTNKLLKLFFNGGGFSLDHITLFKGQTPVAVHAIPGTIQAEQFDFGGEGVSFHDSDTTNTGEELRLSEGVDIAAATDTLGGNHIASITDGEWLEYSVSHIDPGNYTIIMRAASGSDSPKSITLSLSGDSIITIPIPNTGGDQTWQNVIVNNVVISGASNKVLRFTFHGSGFNLNYISFLNVQTAYKTHTIPGIIQVEDFDYGGEGVAYHDEDPTDGGRTARPGEGVGTENTADEGGGYNVGWTKEREWLEYTVGSIVNGIYDISVRAAAPSSGASVLLKHIKGSSPGDTVTLGIFVVRSTGDWQAFATNIIKGVEINNGDELNIIRLEFRTGGLNVNWIKFEETITSINNENTLPVEFDLSQNYPNPFNPTTILNFSLPQSSYVNLTIYNTLGEKIVTLINENLSAGKHYVSWDGKNMNGNKVVSGVYLYRIEAGSFTKTNKMIMLK